MGKNRPPTHEEEPDEKKYRTDDGTNLPTDDVEIFFKPQNTKGVVLTGTFFSKIGHESMQAIKNRVQQEDERTIGSNEFELYPAFKEALLRILTKIEESLADESNPVRMIIVHGVPNIGKSSLALCLSYYLAFYAGGKEGVHFYKLSHSAMVNDEVITQKITIAGNNKYVVVDQVNTDSLKLEEILRCVKNRLKLLKNRMPLVMFTSGHYSPSEKWLSLQASGLLCYKIITMHIDAAVVNKLRGVPAGDVISNEELLQVTNLYSRMQLCVEHLTFCDSKAREDTLEDIIYPGADLRLIRKKSVIHFVWLAWEKLFSVGLPSQDQFSEDHCKMNPYHAEYLGSLISEVRDTRDQGINAILNEMDVTGDTMYEKNNYLEFKSDSYSYRFLHKRGLYEVLQCAQNDSNELSKEEKYHLLLKAFHRLSTGDNHCQYLEGGLFGMIITALCNKTCEIVDGPVGMFYTPAGLHFIRVSCSEAVATEHELCALPLKHEVCKDKSMTFWCNLNVPGKQPFKGFDFAYMETVPHSNKPTVKKLQLFQVTVNPRGKSYDKRLIVTDVLRSVTRELVNQRLVKSRDVDTVICPLFVHPHAVNGKIVLPYRNCDEKIEVDIIGFPEYLLLESPKQNIMKLS